MWLLKTIVWVQKGALVLGEYLSVHECWNQNNIFSTLPHIPSTGCVRDAAAYWSQESKHCSTRNHRVSVFQVRIRVTFTLNCSLSSVLNALCQNKRWWCACLRLIKYCHELKVTTWAAWHHERRHWETRGTLNALHCQSTEPCGYLSFMFNPFVNVSWISGWHNWYSITKRLESK